MADDQTIPIRRATIPIPDFVAAQQQAQAAAQKQETKYPSETIPLPTRGWFYPDSSPLSTGEIEIKQMTAKEEDILANQDLMKNGKVLDKLLESLILNKLIKIDEILVPDKDAIFIAIRRLAYGESYPVRITCPECRKVDKVTIDLSTLTVKPFNFDSYPKGQNSFTFQLPNSKKTLTYKLLSEADERRIDVETEQMKKVYKDNPKSVTTRLKHIILAVDNNPDASIIRKFVDEELTAKDNLALRKHWRETSPGIDKTFDFKCNNTSCSCERRLDMPIEASFLWPDFES